MSSAIPRKVGSLWQQLRITVPVALFAMQSVLLGACASFDPEWRCHTGALDCSPNAVRNRVLGAFATVPPVDVLECVSIPSLACYSWDPDEEACLVRLSPADAASFSEEEGDPAQVPLAVLRLNNNDQRLLSRGSTMKTELREQAIYANTDRSAFIMFVAERRCSNLEEEVF
jgi:hypothetical protein